MNFCALDTSFIQADDTNTTFIRASISNLTHPNILTNDIIGVIMDINLYGLLHLTENEASAMNVQVDNFEQQKELYIKNATTLSKSLARRGISFTLLTNRIQSVHDVLTRMGQTNNLKVEGIDCTYKLPSGIRFYSAHYKFDVFRYLSSLVQERYVGLIDLDMIAVSDIPTCLINIVNSNIPVCYDISDQVIPAYGHDTIIDDMKKLDATIGEGRWCGGELIMGPPDFFKLLKNEIDLIYDKYIISLADFHHQGDEMVTSVALERLRNNGKYIADGGTLGIVGRYWSICTLHPQKPFSYFKNCFLLHLPSDKNYLAGFDYEIARQRDNFIQKYDMYRRQKKLLSIISNLIRRLRKISLR
jgi:hypothetical protein